MFKIRKAKAVDGPWMPWCPVSNSGWSVEQNRLPRHTCHSLLKPLIDSGLRAPREFLPLRVRAYLYWLQVSRTKIGLISGQALWWYARQEFSFLEFAVSFFCRKTLLLYMDGGGRIFDVRTNGIWKYCIQFIFAQPHCSKSNQSEKDICWYLISDIRGRPYIT